VIERAAKGSEYHVGALQFLAIHSPHEFARITEDRA